MITKQTPAFTYATPARAVRSVEKMGVAQGGTHVRFVISKDNRGRYFPVYVGRIAQIESADTKKLTKKVAKKTTRVKIKKDLH